MESKSTNNEPYFHSLNCVDVFIDEPGDTTIRPCDPKMLEQAKALRDRIRAAEAAGIDLTEQDVRWE